MTQSDSNPTVEIHKFSVAMKIKFNRDDTWNNCGKPDYKNNTFANIPKEIKKAIAAKKFFVKSIDSTKNASYK